MQYRNEHPKQMKPWARRRPSASWPAKRAGSAYRGNFESWKWKAGSICKKILGAEMKTIPSLEFFWDTIKECWDSSYRFFMILTQKGLETRRPRSETSIPSFQVDHPSRWFLKLDLCWRTAAAPPWGWRLKHLAPESVPAWSEPGREDRKYRAIHGPEQCALFGSGWKAVIECNCGNCPCEGGVLCNQNLTTYSQYLR